MDAPRSEGDRTVAGSLSTALEELKDILVPGSESLVLLLGHIGAAFEYTVDPNEHGSVAYHCREAIRVIEAIERRHAGDLPEQVAACLNGVQRDLEHALRRADPESGDGAVSGNP